MSDQVCVALIVGSPTVHIGSKSVSLIHSFIHTTRDPDKRPEANELLDHEWVQDVSQVPFSPRRSLASKEESEGSFSYARTSRASAHFSSIPADIAADAVEATKADSDS